MTEVYRTPANVEGTVLITTRVNERELGLHLDLAVNVVRSPRRKCPVCTERRVLYRLTAWAKGQAAGSSEARCAKCAGFRA